ncbi:MAG TPA: hypothetical protein VI504_00665 [Candidatus Eisenbacteria bacterium]
MQASCTGALPGEFSHTQHLETGLECEGCHVLASGDPRPQETTCEDCHE